MPFLWLAGPLRLRALTFQARYGETSPWLVARNLSATSGGGHPRSRRLDASLARRPQAPCAVARSTPSKPAVLNVFNTGLDNRPAGAQYC